MQYLIANYMNSSPKMHVVVFCILHMLSIFVALGLCFSKVECYFAALVGVCVADIHLGSNAETSIWRKCENFQKTVAKCFEGASNPTWALHLDPLA